VRPNVSRQVLLSCLLAALLASAAEAPRPIKHLKPTVILVSLDGFRYDYWDKAEAPNLKRLIAGGVRAEALLPSFPTYTFPNHYTMVTGLYPAHHGIVANEFYDPAREATFKPSDHSSILDPEWWGGEPIWVTAHKQGQRSAPIFWVGSEASIHGIRPDYWQPFDKNKPADARVADVLAQLDLPPERRPTFLTLYLEDVDHAGHDYGPDSPEVRQAISAVDSAIGLLLEGLRRRGIENQPNIIVVSDHGMAAASPDHVIYLDDYVDLSRIRVVSWGPMLSVWPKSGSRDETLAALRNVRHLSAYARDNTPARWHYNRNSRIAPVIAVADEGWTITSHERQQTHKPLLGQHGYDNNLHSMRGIFVARGPAFRPGSSLPAFPNTDIYDLLAYLLHLRPAQNDGSLEVFRPVLVKNESRKHSAPQMNADSRR
jgi:predicted AlkP superfamily pyrophosphatase or phosphodiesterase